MVLHFILFFLSLIHASFGVGGEFIFLQKALKRNDNEHDEWCYLDNHCSPTSSNSSWDRGLCKHGTQQSPINIKIAGLVPEKDSESLKLKKNGVLEHYNLNKYKLENKGKTVQVTLHDHEVVTFGWHEKHNGVYRLHHIDFHWGPSSQVGSEHQIEGQSFAMEMHLVHYRSNGPESYPGFPHISEAVLSGDKNALVVITLLLHADVYHESPSFLEPIASAIPLIKMDGNKTHLRHNLSLGNILGDQKEAFVYEGSLTTPPCSEIVTWVICRHPIKILEEEVNAFRQIVSKVNVVNGVDEEVRQVTNHRKVQHGNEFLLHGKKDKKHDIKVRLLKLM